MTPADYVRADFALVPIPPGCKGPNTAGWNLRERCITSADAAAHLSGNIGLAHAYSGTCALDLDDCAAADAWFGERGVSLRELRDDLFAVHIDSGRPNRDKLIFRLDSALPTVQRKNDRGEVVFELRCATRDGLTVQDVLPPSIHPETGRPYTWKLGPLADWRSPPPLPEALRAIWAHELSSDSTPPRAEVRELAALRDPVAILLRERGMIRSTRKDGALNVECPNAGEHTTPANETETVYFPPHTGGYERGNFRCLHAHCARLGREDFLRLLGYQDPAAAPEASKSERRAPIDWHALDGREPPARKWVISHWVPDGHMTLLAGRGGIGKTLLAQHVATAVAIGRPYLEPIEPRCVLFWAGEDDEPELWRRQRPIADYFGVQLRELVDRLTLVSYAGADMTLMAPVYGRLQETPTMAELRAQVGDYRAQLVILDNIARLYGGGENDRHAVTKFCALVQGACAPAAVLLLGHPAKAAGSEFSGSTAWEAAVRARLYLDDKPPDADEDDRPIDPRVRYLARRKSNYSPLELRRFDLRGGVLLPDIVAVTQPSAASMRDVVLAAVAKLAEMGQHGSASTASPNYLPKLAKQYGLLGQHGQKDFAAAMRQALVDGALVNAEVGKYPNRTPKLGIRLHK